VSEVDVNGTIRNTFTDVDCPQHLSSDNEGHVFVADTTKDRVLLLNSQLKLQCVLVDGSFQDLWAPTRLCYNQLASQLYVLHQHPSTDSAVSLFSLRWSSGGASAVKEPGHFEVRKSSSQVTRMHFFPQKKLATFFSCRPQNTGRQRHFTVKIKQTKRSAVVTFLFSVHTITEAKQYAGLSRSWARAVDLQARLFDQARPGVAPPLRWSSLLVLVMWFVTEWEYEFLDF